MKFDYITKEDIQRIVEINSQCNLDTVSLSFLKKHIFESAYKTIFVKCISETGVVGYAGLVFVPGDGQAEIDNIAVVPEMRRRGIAKKMLEKVEGDAKAFGVEEVFLEVRSKNEPAIGLYSSSGYVSDYVRKNYYKNPADDALIMKKKL